MATTSTIRVPSPTRDKLAAQARARGVSLAAFLTEIARDQELEAMFESERRARLAEADDPAAHEEARLWESTLEDGID